MEHMWDMECMILEIPIPVPSMYFNPNALTPCFHTETDDSYTVLYTPTQNTATDDNDEEDSSLPQ